MSGTREYETSKRSKSFRVILIVLGIFVSLSCINIPGLEFLENLEDLEELKATGEAVMDEAELYITPVENFQIKPGDERGDLILSWEHPLGDQLDYEVHINDIPITEDNWTQVGYFTIKKKDLDVEKIGDTYRLTYTWKEAWVNTKFWITIRQSVQGLEEAKAFVDFIGPLVGFEIPEETWSIPPSILPSSEILTVVDTGIRPAIDGFQFQNAIPSRFRPAVTSSSYIDMLRWLYGEKDVCISTKDGHCNPRLGALNQANQSVTEGQCSGFTTSAGLFFSNKTEYMNSLGLNPKTKTIDINPVKTYKAYEYIMGYQQIQGKAKRIFDDSLEKHISSIEKIMLDKNRNVNLSVGDIRPDDESGRHAILPYLLIQEDAAAMAWVYDSNYPYSSEKVVNYDLENNTWSYLFQIDKTGKEEIWQGNNHNCINDCIGYRDIGDFENIESGAYIGKAPWFYFGKLIPFNKDAALLITSTNGLSIGYDDTGMFYDEIPDATIEITDEYGNGYFMLPPGNYTYAVSNTSSSEANFMIMGEGQVLSMENISPGDEYIVTESSVEYQNNSAATTPQISIIVEEEQRSSRMTIQPQLSAGTELVIDYDPTTLEYEIYASDDIEYDLDISVITPEGEADFESTAFDHNSGETEIIELEELKEEEEDLTIEIDTDGDGESDETIDVENEAEPGDEDEDTIEKEFPWKTVLIILGIIAGIGLVILVIFLIQRNQQPPRGGRPGSSRRSTARPSSRARTSQRNSRTQRRPRTTTRPSSARRPPSRPSRPSSRSRNNRSSRYRR